MVSSHYIYNLHNKNYIELKQLPKLTIIDIKYSSINNNNKILFYAFYNYYNELDKCSLNELSQSYVVINIMYMNKLNMFKYFIIRGIKFITANYYSLAIIYNCYNLLPYYESLGFNINTYNPFQKIYLSSYKLKTFKYLYNKGFNLNIIIGNKINLFIKELITMKPNIKSLKYLKSKGVNIYIKQNGDNPYIIMRKQYFKPHKNTFLFLNKLYSFNYCASKLLYIYFVFVFKLFWGPQIILGAPNYFGGPN
jgi:hypothetical protein